MYSYYIERGHNLTDLINLSYVEKQFYIESMEFNKDERIKDHNAKWGGEKK